MGAIHSKVELARSRVLYDHLAATHADLLSGSLIEWDTSTATNGITDRMAATVGSYRPDSDRTSQCFGTVINANSRAFWVICVGDRVQLSAAALRRQREEDLATVKQWARDSSLSLQELDDHYGISSRVTYSDGVLGGHHIVGSGVSVPGNAHNKTSKTPQKKRRHPGLDQEGDYEAPGDSPPPQNTSSLLTAKSKRSRPTHVSLPPPHPRRPSAISSKPTTRTRKPQPPPSLSKPANVSPPPQSSLLPPGPALPSRARANSSTISSSFRRRLPRQVVHSPSAYTSLSSLSKPGMPPIVGDVPSQSKNHIQPVETASSGTLPSAAEGSTPTSQHLSPQPPPATVPTAVNAASLTMIRTAPDKPPIPDRGWTRDEEEALAVRLSSHSTAEARLAASELLTFDLECSTAAAESQILAPWTPREEAALRLQLEHVADEDGGRQLKYAAGQRIASRFRRRLEVLRKGA